jgi:Right handed beta helix region
LRGLLDRRTTTGRLRAVAVGLALAAFALVLPAGALGHSERATQFPDPNQGAFPAFHASDAPSIVVCRKDTNQRIADYEGALRQRNQRLLRRCRFANIQRAVNVATNGTTILVMPGVYKELPSLGPPPAGCEATYAQVQSGNVVLSYEQERQCPHAKNLIAVMGDTNDNRICDSKCNIQIEGTGALPEEVLVQGERFSGPAQRLNLLRADRADGIVVTNMKFEYSDFNNVYFLETNGFRFSHVVTAHSREYGILSFTSDHGIYEYCEAYGNGDSGVYPGSGPNARHGQPDAHGDVYGILIHDCDSHDNLMGWSSTAGNGTWGYRNKFHHNAAGIVTDALVSGHPGMPPDHVKLSENLFYSNNKNLFSDGPIPPGTYTDDTQTGRDSYCKQPLSQRDLRVVCPSFMMPVGSGLVLAGANSDIVKDNYFFDNWRLGTLLFYVPATVRGENDPSRQSDVSNNNRQEGNCMDTRPASLDPNQIDFAACEGTRDRNGVDFYWDEQEGTDCPEVDQDPGTCTDASDGLGNCWTANQGFDGGVYTSDPPVLVLPACPGIDVPRPPNGSKSAFLVPCVTWDPQTNTDPPGCETPPGTSWFSVPPEPQP